jgi:serine/threonine protein kinase
MALGPGVRFGPYEILQPIGAGGMGEVHRARHVKLRRDVAIKVLPPALGCDPSRLARFEREARTASATRYIMACSSASSLRSTRPALSGIA